MRPVLMQLQGLGLRQIGRDDALGSGDEGLAARDNLHRAPDRKIDGKCIRRLREAHLHSRSTLPGPDIEFTDGEVQVLDRDPAAAHDRKDPDGLERTRIVVAQFLEVSLDDLEA